MTKPKYVDDFKWAAGVRYLMGHDSDILNSHERKQLQQQFRGPFYHGFKEREDAIKVLDAMGWRIKR